MAGVRPLSPQWLFTRLWRRPGFRRVFYSALGYAFFRRRDWQMMNCGFLRPAMTESLPPEWRHEMPSYGLYAGLLEGTPLAGRDVLEIGAGRGGGARFMHRFHQPRRLVAMDFAPGLVRWCQASFAAPGLEFRTGDAADLPADAGQFDVVVAVELTHCLADKPRFLAGVARVLRPGGRLLIADFFYRRPDSMHALGKFEAALADSPFAVVAGDDWTPQVIAAIESDSARRAAEIGASVPWFLRKAAAAFASTTSSSTYAGLREGRTVYRRFVLERRA